MENVKLTIGMMTYDDYHGVYQTIQNIMTNHRDVLNRLHFVVIDNNPDSPHGQETAGYVRGIPNATYSQIRGTSSTSFRNIVFEIAPTDYVLCMDCHVFVAQNALARLIRFYEANPGCHDLLHGPMMNEKHEVYATHMDPCFRGWNFGIWGNEGKADDPTADPFEIPMHGMGLFACTRPGWLRFSPGLRYFGAEEGTIHERFRRHGRRAWCLPFLGWIHRFGRPGGATYRNQAIDKARNYLTAFRDAGLPLDVCANYFKRHLHQDPNVQNREMGKLLEEINRLPTCSLPPAPEGYQPFLGKEMKVLD